MENDLSQADFPFITPEDKRLADNQLSPQARVVMIINLHAGSFAASPALAEMIDELTKPDVTLEIHQTKSVGDGTRLARRFAPGADLVVCAGGDGTLNEVASGLIGLDSAPPLAYIPAGTTCDFARTLRLPINEYREAAQVAYTGIPMPLDIGQLNTAHFVYVASFGAFTQVATSTPRKLKKNLGQIAYLIEGLRSLPAIKPIRVRIELEDAVMEENLIFGAVSNSTSIGGLLRVPEDQVLMDDGKFEVMLLRQPDNPLATPAMLNSLLNQDFRDRNILFFSTPSIRFFFPDGPVHWTTDGEDAGTSSEVSVRNLKRAWRIILPAETANSM